jgi:hypothetical protein
MKPKDCGGLGILNLTKYASTLHLRWLLYEWYLEAKHWVGLGNVCTPQDIDLFLAATNVTIGNGKKALFWDASWINGMRPKDIAPLIFDLSKRKKCTIAKALEDNFWVSNQQSRWPIP